MAAATVAAAAAALAVGMKNAVQVRPWIEPDWFFVSLPVASSAPATFFSVLDGEQSGRREVTATTMIWNLQTLGDWPSEVCLALMRVLASPTKGTSCCETWTPIARGVPGGNWAFLGWDTADTALAMVEAWIEERRETDRHFDCGQIEARWGTAVHRHL